MPITSEFLNQLKYRLRAFSVKDEKTAMSLLEMGIVMYNMGWWKKMGWYIDQLEELYRQCGDRMSEDLRGKFREYISFYKVTKYVIGDMDSYRAYRTILKMRQNVSPYIFEVVMRVFYEYLGNYPLAYKYISKAVSNPREDVPVVWWRCRLASYRMCGGKRRFPFDVDLKRCGKGENVPGVEEMEEMNRLVEGYVMAIALLMGILPDEEETVKEISDRVRLGIDRNYDHMALRLLQILVPILYRRGRISLSKGFIKVAMSTAKTERNRYMYEWFRLYWIAITGERDPDRLRRMARFYIRRKYISHYLLSKVIGVNLGVFPKEDLEESNDLAERYWQKCVLKLGEYLFTP